MTEREKFMYQILGEISNTNAPLVFKGALITKLVLLENGYADLERVTKDIDANWVDKPPSSDELVKVISRSLGKYEDEYYAKIIREYTENQSAGVIIADKNTGEELLEMDIGIMPVLDSKIYHFGEIKIKGVLASEIISDKISAISDKVIFRRAKDLIDIYALSHCVEVKTTEIYENSCKSGNEIKSFYEFYNRKSDVEHAYNKLKGVENKPSFDKIYGYLEKFLRPFAENDRRNRAWNSNILLWKSNQKNREYFER